MYDLLRTILPDAEFAPPAASSEVEAAERALNFKFPDWLRGLYSHCDGFTFGNAACLYSVSGLVFWNKFLREEWHSNLPEFKKVLSEQECEKLDPGSFLIIATLHGTLLNWAVKADDPQKIYGFDGRSEREPWILAADFVEVCKAHAKWVHDVNEELSRGREFYFARNENQNPRDIDRLFRELEQRRKADYKTKGLGYIQRSISQRPGETGELYIAKGESALRFVSRDGNYPIQLRLKVSANAAELSCTVWNLEDAIGRIVVINRLRPPDESELRRIFSAPSKSDPELTAIADVLCARDDRRLVEENRLG